MEFIERELVPHIEKEHGTSIWYYIFPEHEIHYNEIQPRAVQPWHHHEQTDESIFVLEGELRISWLDEKGEKINQIATPGTVIRIGNSVHTLSNLSQEITRFLVFKFVPTGSSKHELIKGDKILDQVKE